MVGMMMTANSHERLAGLMDSAIFAADIPSKLDRLRQSKQDLVRQQDPDLLSELLPRFFELQSDRFSPVRKFATEMLGEIGLMHVELLPDIVPSLIDVLSDETPAVARQAITSGSNLFRCVLEKVSIQGLHASELDSSLESAWACVLKLKDEIYSIAFRPGSGGVRLRALKFVESVILLYTPDPNGSPGPPALEGDLVEFNVSWLRGGHPLLNVGDLSIEASKSLGLLLDQLRFPTVKSLGNLVIVVLINSLSAIAKKRPAFYGRILPVLLGFDPSSTVMNGVHVSGPRHALKNAFLTCLKCTHQGAAPLEACARLTQIWSQEVCRRFKERMGEAGIERGMKGEKREEEQDACRKVWRDRLVGALRKMQAGGLVELATQQECKINGSVEDGQDDSLVTKDEKPTITITNTVQSSFGKKRLGPLDGSDLAVDQDISGKRAKSTSSFSGDSAKEVGRNVSASLDDVSSSGTTTSRGDGDNGPVQQLVAMFGALVAQGEKAVGSLEILISSISADLLAEVVMANMCNLPPNLLGDEGDESLMNMHIVGGDSRVKYPPSFIADVLSLTSTFPPIAALLDAHQSVSSDIVKSEQEEEQVPDVVDSGVASTGMDFVFGDETAILPMRLSASSEMEHVTLESLQGHELTLRVLYRLFGEAEEERDFFSSTTATSVYEMFLSTAVDTLKDSFPPSDKSLSRLLGEVPYLPDSVLKFLECMCSPGNCDKTEKETQGGDRVTQGLSIVWSLILLRPPLRDPCLKIALQSAVHHLEEVRMKAIRLVANKLYPLSFIAQRIEDFAIEKLLSLKSCDATEKIDAEGSKYELQKDSDSEKHSNEPPSVSGNSKDISSDNHQSFSSQNVSSLSITEAQRCLSLYFALCTKKHSLFRQIFVVYGSASKAIKQAVQRQIPILVRTMGSSPNLLEIISDPPTGSENLLMQVLHTLTDGTVPSQELIFTVRKLYDSKLKDIEILIPILPFLPKDEVLLIFPQLMNLQLDKFQAALARILQGSSQSGPLLAPAEILIAIHGIDPDRDGIPLKKAYACNACFEQRQIFTQQVLAKVLNQLVEQIPLPLLFMRTVLQAIGAFPALVDFIMEILSRLVSKQIWKYPKLWVGFLKCTFLTKPQSFAVLLQLPPAQLENALKRTAALKGPLVAHASQPDIRSSLPRSILVVLGIVSDSPAQTSQSQAAAQTSQSQAAAQTSQSQAVAQASQFQAEAHTSQSQAEAQTSQSQAEAQTSQSQTEAQSSQSQAGEASNSEKDAVTEKPKESSSAS
ncbi:hypothetical protein C1H46_032036 [Malus baccata]|uniref:Symplekin C-terminal domain-containing protein n=1 Tax=Malus baccata TaxID=106549 RepID=A0A540L7E3_MALBA|nr:hypothetical protein C1H46_032036 [Malus baccata]